MNRFAIRKNGAWYIGRNQLLSESLKRIRKCSLRKMNIVWSVNLRFALSRRGAQLPLCGIPKTKSGLQKMKEFIIVRFVFVSFREALCKGARALHTFAPLQRYFARFACDRLLCRVCRAEGTHDTTHTTHTYRRDGDNT